MCVSYLCMRNKITLENIQKAYKKILHNHKQLYRRLYEYSLFSSFSALRICVQSNVCNNRVLIHDYQPRNVAIPLLFRGLKEKHIKDKTINRKIRCSAVLHWDWYPYRVKFYYSRPSDTSRKVNWSPNIKEPVMTVGEKKTGKVKRSEQGI